MQYTRGDGETVVSIPSRFINPSLKRPVPLAKLNYNETRRRYMQTVKEPSMCGKCKEVKCNKKCFLQLLKELSNPNNTDISENSRLQFPILPALSITKLSFFSDLTAKLGFKELQEGKIEVEGGKQGKRDEEIGSRRAGKGLYSGGSSGGARGEGGGSPPYL